MEPHEPGKGRLYITEMSPEDLEKHIQELLKDRPPWKPGAYYNDAGDILSTHWSETEYYAEWLNDRVTLLRSQHTDEVVGCQIWGLSAIMDEATREIKIKHHPSREDEGHTCGRDDPR